MYNKDNSLFRNHGEGKKSVGKLQGNIFGSVFVSLNLKISSRNNNVIAAAANRSNYYNNHRHSGCLSVCPFSFPERRIHCSPVNKDQLVDIAQ